MGKVELDVLLLVAFVASAALVVNLVGTAAVESWAPATQYVIQFEEESVDAGYD